jgi:hypothetical protein
VKRWRDGGGFDDERERERREEAARTPLVVQSLAPQGRGRRLVLPLAAGGLALMFVLAMVGRYVTYFAAESQTPAAPTPVAWLDATVAQTPTAVPAVTPDPSATLVPLVSVRIGYQPFLQVPGDTIRFTVVLTNTSGRSVSFEPCPTFRMYLPGSTFPEPERLLNCAAAGSTLLQGDSLSFAMLYRIPIDVAPGGQLLVWELTGGLRGTDSTELSIEAPATSTP